MGVYIKGMEMPTLYRTYKVRFSESGDGKIVVGIANEDSTAYRPIGEVISVPPHGRLIDADVLKSGINEAMKSALKGDAVTVYGVALAGFVAQGFIEEIENAPTIIPAEEGE